MVLTPHRRRSRGEDGAALLTVIMILGLVGALSLTLAVVTTNNLVSARLAQQAGAALNASDAGVSQAVTYLRENGVGAVNQCPSACATPWGNKDNPAVVTVGGRAGQSYRVWIEPIAKFPANRPGVYRIHSTGIAGGPAGRTVTVDAAVDLVKFPLGIATNSTVAAGEAKANGISLFASGCVYRRDKIVFTGIDKAYGIPAAAHSSRTITVSQGSGTDCPGTNKPIHDKTKPNSACHYPAVADLQPADGYAYDQDRDGGDLAGTACENLAASKYPGESQLKDPAHPAYRYPQTSYIDEGEMLKRFGVRRPPLSQAQLEYLKGVAVAQENFWTSGTGWTVPTEDHAVVYFDLTTAPAGARRVNLTDFTPQKTASLWYRPPNPAGCTNRSLLILIEGGDATLPADGEHAMAASLFLLSEDPYGNMFKATGASVFTGTVYANSFEFAGGASMNLDQCFLNNLAPSLTTVSTYNYREVDR